VLRVKLVDPQHKSLLEKVPPPRNDGPALARNPS